ncbi:EthD family reductase [Nesterenkonia sp. Act20]|uniref:EthD family reductase n=1 Tax=Nesterenkonia sp. Act20 TaxID=1483432 RepID=UPI001C449412|nr:EthD family reductase [Nesterenkonia sp. Act20]
MATKIAFIIDNPSDPTVFETAYEDVLKLANQLPDQQRLESAKVWPKEDGSATPAYRTLDIYFDTYEAASAAVATPVAGDFFQRLIATDVPFKALFSEIEQA